MQDDSLHAEERLTALEEEDAEDRLEVMADIIDSNSLSPCSALDSFLLNRLPCKVPTCSVVRVLAAGFPSLYLRWGFSLFLKRVSRFGLPHTSWRSKCPYQQPPPLILAEGVEEADWGDEQRREYVRRRLRRKRLGSDVNPLIPTVLPNLLLFSLLLWNPFPDNDS
ncbi:hypothetical protein JRO89_XS06G0065000 [Xanthoceras sorbifolium]|uniref:Uncharacterized protein n=1 Tax=Xanthoceras sorbifolium TaxID=99658 RepID=A0ABQ8HWY7_9ROSI|nr:hypothetical protein JRO89_XS06G0065000 [Xanthoceras sorbifolium]